MKTTNKTKMGKKKRGAKVAQILKHNLLSVFLILIVVWAIGLSLVIFLDVFNSESKEITQNVLDNAISKFSKFLLGNSESEGESNSGIEELRMNITPAPELILDKVAKSIISYVGEEYFNEHITIEESLTNEETDKIGAKYRIDYIYNFIVKGDDDETIKRFSLWLDSDGELVEYAGINYRGPQKPYSFNISRSNAIEIAVKEGLPESSFMTAEIKFGLDFGIDESYLWHITTENYQSGKPSAILIDVDSGEFLRTVVSRRDIFTVGGIFEEQKNLIDNIVGDSYPEVLEKTFLFLAERTESPDQFKLVYISPSAIPESPSAIIIVDLEKEEIISIEKHNWE